MPKPRARRGRRRGRCGPCRRCRACGRSPGCPASRSCRAGGPSRRGSPPGARRCGGRRPGSAGRRGRRCTRSARRGVLVRAMERAARASRSMWSWPTLTVATSRTPSGRAATVAASSRVPLVSISASGRCACAACSSSARGHPDRPAASRASKASAMRSATASGMSWLQTRRGRRSGMRRTVRLREGGGVLSHPGGRIGTSMSCAACVDRPGERGCRQHDPPPPTSEAFNLARWPLVKPTDRHGAGAGVGSGSGPSASESPGVCPATGGSRAATAPSWRRHHQPTRPEDPSGASPGRSRWSCMAWRHLDEKKPKMAVPKTFPRHLGTNGGSDHPPTCRSH